MDLTHETKQQSAAESLSAKVYEKGSETIPTGSTLEKVETGNTLTSNVAGEDIVQKFIKKSKLRFGTQYDYSLVVYVNAKTKVKIKCNKHNHIFEQTPDKHLQGSIPCPLCLTEHKSLTTPLKFCDKAYNTLKYYQNRLFEKFNQQFTLIGNYEGIESTVKTTCKLHGEQQSSINNLLQKHRKYCCNDCANVAKTNSKIKQPPLLDTNKFTVDFSNYKNRKSIVKCTCPIHGIFYKKVQNIVSGQGCFRCKIDELIKKNVLVGGYSEELFNNKPELKSKLATLYLLKIGHLHKIGITTKNVNNRVKGIKAKAKSFGESVDIIVVNSHNDTLYNCFIKEQAILQENIANRVFKKWSTELLKNFDEDKFMHTP